MTAGPVLYGRDTELRRLRSLLVTARAGDGGCLVLRGEAGMGKTALLGSPDVPADVVSLSIGGVRAERELPFAALQRLQPGFDPAGEPLRLRCEVHERLVAHAAGGPVLCRVDDAQWLDAASLDVLGFVARRLAGHPVALVLAGRPELAPVAGTESLWLGPLPDEACERLRHDRPVPAGLRAALADLAGGNPLDLVALAASLTPEQLAGRAPLPDELPEGSRRADLGALSPAGLVLLLCAIAESTVDLPLLSRLGPVGEVLESGLLRVEGTSPGLPSKAVRSTLYALAPVRREAHQQLAGVLGGPRGLWHRAMAEPGSSASLADEPAGAPAPDPMTAATILERAAALTIHNGLRASRLFAAARQAWQAGRPGWARVRLRGRQPGAAGRAGARAALGARPPLARRDRARPAPGRARRLHRGARRRRGRGAAQHLDRAPHAARPVRGAARRPRRRSIHIGHRGAGDRGARASSRPCAIASWAHACLDLADDRPSDALGRLEAMAAGVSGAQPGIQVLATPQLVEAAVLVEQPDRAERALAVFDAWVHADGSDAWLALSHRCHGLLAEEPEHHFDTAITLHRKAGAAMELARTQLACARRLRRRRRSLAAREQLREALRVFRSVGADRWAERTRTAPRAAGEPTGSGASLDGLTPQQAEISRLVAVGETSKEIARRLVISHRTVDHHLRNIFIALGVRSRVELARRVAGLK